MVILNEPHRTAVSLGTVARPLSTESHLLRSIKSKKVPCPRFSGAVAIDEDSRGGGAERERQDVLAERKGRE